ncbi:VirD4-like conjugal transfer protein, CD1115 family [Carboxydothermus ferrireducens]|uniref:Type IV secretion system protein VirD4 n=1 Tax=Carboxydothermus ferrireducens DSM 11255 TaxID=1119529 RepID=A0ABX2R7L9_9THEO|nr:type IV secretory system conjugative DNA transfer family protein [Carboxydothermus ferrireducens]NYE57168.1 type IV secretion system protein VirD4 [Carboxydothermus ferrireducens DSM 11255]
MSLTLAILLAFILDAWLLGSLSAYFQATQTAFKSGNMLNPDLSYPAGLIKNPFLAVWELLKGFVGASHFPIGLWLLFNTAVLIIAFAYLLKSGRINSLATPKFVNRPDKGTSSWLTFSEMARMFKFDYETSGILLGGIKQFWQLKPVVLPLKPIDNRNVAIFGPPGTGKSRGYIRNNLFHAVKSGWSVIVTDPKGELARDFKSWFEEKGYTVRIFNLVSMLNSDRWNPLSVVKSDIDAQQFAEVVIANTAVPGRKGGDPFWDRAEMNLLKALALYVVNELPDEEKNLGSLYHLLASGNFETLSTCFDGLPADHPAKLPWNIFCETSGTVRSGVIIGLGSRLQVFQNKLVQRLTATSDIDLELPGKEKCAYFCILSDTDSTFDFLASLFFSFLFIKLVRLADSMGKELDVPVNFLLDEFCNIGHIPDFTKKLSTMRSRGIGCSIVFQNIGQLRDYYPGNGWETILGDCDTWVVLGAKDKLTADYIEKILGYGTIETESIATERGKIFDLGRTTKTPAQRELMQLSELLRLPRDEQIVITAHSKPARLKKLDYTCHPWAKELKPEPISRYIPGWAKRLEQSEQGEREEKQMQEQPEQQERAQQGAKPHLEVDDGFWY